MHKILSDKWVDGILFGSSSETLKKLFENKWTESKNRRGDIEICVADVVYRYNNSGLFEVTMSILSEEIEINGEIVLGIKDWIAKTDVNYVDYVGFRISPALGLAFDTSDDKYGYLSAFRFGTWDTIIAKSKRA